MIRSSILLKIFACCVLLQQDQLLIACNLAKTYKARANIGCEYEVSYRRIILSEDWPGILDSFSLGEEKFLLTTWAQTLKLFSLPMSGVRDRKC